MTEKLGVAVLGTGWVAGEHIRAFSGNPHTEVVAILSRDRGRAEAKAREHSLARCRPYTDLEELLRDDSVRIVSVCTPHQLHAAQGIAAAQAGRHILVEKPIALDLRELRALEEAVQKAGVKSLVSFVLRWNPLFETIKTLLADRMLGDLFLAEVGYLSGISGWYAGYEWMRKKRYGGSNLLSAGCHAVDAVRWFVGGTVEEVFSYSNTGAGNRLGYEYDTNSITLMRFGDGTIGKVTCSIEAVSPYTFPILLMGTGGTLRNNELFTGRWKGQTDWATIPTILPDTADVSHHPFAAQINHFVDCILNDEESHCNIADAARTHEISLAADLSACEGRPVKLPLES